MAVIFASWDPPDYAFIRDYLVELTQGATLIDSQTIPVGTELYESPTVANDQDFVVSVVVRSTLGPVSLAALVSIHTTGNTLGRHPYTTAATLVNMHEMYDWGTGQKYWVTAMSDHWQSNFGSNINSYANPLLTYHASGTSTLTTEAFDFGSFVSASFASSMVTVAVSGTPIQYIETAPGSPPSWTRQTNPYSGSAQFVRLSSETTGTDTQRVNSLGEVIATA
jgi:hypothetical protein